MGKLIILYKMES